MADNFPKYQWSTFTDRAKKDQLVIRADTYEEFQKAKSKVLADIGEGALRDQQNGEPEWMNEDYDVPGEPTVVKNCPKCGSEMWDNRPKKASGEFNPKAPDFKCKQCDHVIWPPKK